MIIPLPFIVSLLFTISYATDFKYEIEFDRCKGDNADTTCYVRKSCTMTDPADDSAADPAATATAIADFAAAKQILYQVKPTDIQLSKKCDAIVQIKAFSKAKYLVMMQVTADDLDGAKGIAIKQNDFEQMACRKDGDGKIVYNSATQKETTKADAKDVTFLKLEGTTSSVLEKTRLLCSFFVTSGNAKHISDNFDTVDDGTSHFDNNAPILAYSTTSEDFNLPYDKVGVLFWEDPAKNSKCTVRQAWFSIDPTHNTYILEEADISRSPITCPENKLLVQTTNPVGEAVVEQLTCIERQWYKGKTAKDEDKIIVGQTNIACIKKEYCEACTPLTQFETSDCPNCKPLIKVEQTCQMLKCESKEETVTTDGVNAGITLGEKGIFCRKKSEGISEWASSETDGFPPFTNTKASCFVFKGCTPLTMFDCPEGVECKAEPTFDQPNSNYSCPDADAVLHQDKEKVSLSCAENKWSGIDTSKSLYCAIEEKKGTAAKEDPNTGGGGLIAGVVIGIIVILGLIAGGAFYFLVYKKKKDAKKTTKKEEGTSKKSSKKSGGVGSSDEGTAKKDKDTKKESASEPNKESEKPAAGAEPPKEPAKDGKEPPKDGKEPPKDGKDATPAGAPSPAPPTTPATGTAPGTPAEAPAPAPIPPDATAV